MARSLGLKLSEFVGAVKIGFPRVRNALSRQRLSHNTVYHRRTRTRLVSLKCTTTARSVHRSTVQRRSRAFSGYQKAVDTMENALLRTASYFKRTGLVAVLYLLFSGTPKSLTASSARTLPPSSFALVPNCVVKRTFANPSPVPWLIDPNVSSRTPQSFSKLLMTRKYLHYVQNTSHTKEITCGD